MEYIIIFLICTLSGFLTGLLSIGGGLIIVPLFLCILPLFGISLSLAEIIGISATCVFINSAVTLFYRRHEEKLPANVMKPLIISIIIGTISGGWLANFAPNYVIYLIFICVSLVSIYTINREIYCDLQQKNLTCILYIIFAFIGAISASIGIGGAVLFATALKCFMGKDTKELLPSITVLVFCHALFAFCTKFALGHVTLIIIPIAFCASLIGSKIGVITSKKLSSKILNFLLSLCMLFGLVKVIFELINEFQFLYK